MTVVVFLAGLQTEVAGSQQHGVFGKCAFDFAGPAAMAEVRKRTGATEEDLLMLCGWEVAFEALGVVENAQAALLAKRFELVAFLTADGAGLGDANGHQRQALR